MHFLALLLILIAKEGQSLGLNASERIRGFGGASQTNSDGTLNVTYDCSVYGEEYTSAIWGPSFPDNLHSLAIFNCKYLVLNITIEKDNRKQNFTHLTVQNIEKCEIIAAEVEAEEEEEEEESGGESVEVALPKEVNFIDVRSLSSNVPLLREHPHGARASFMDGVFHLSNVTVEKLTRRAIHIVRSRLKRFTLRRVTVLDAEEEAIAFCGGFRSALQVENSFFHFVPKNFINCNVTSVQILKNKFGSLSSGSFSLSAENFEFSGNSVEEVKSHAFNVTAVNGSLRNNFFHFLRNDSLKGISICGSPSGKGLLTLSGNKADKMEEGALNLNGRYFDDAPKEMLIGQNGSELHPSKLDEKEPLAGDHLEKSVEGGDGDGKPSGSEQRAEGGRGREKGRTEPATSVLHQLGNSFLLLWFLAISGLILLFPIAYFIKICFCKTLDQTFPLQITHRRLHNVDDDT